MKNGDDAERGGAVQMSAGRELDALNVASETTAHWRKRAWALERALAWIRDNPNDGHDVHEVACEALNRSATPVKP